MIRWFSGVAPETWDALRTMFTGITTLVFVVGVPIAIMNLRTIIRNQRLTALNRFADELADTEPDRTFVYRNLVRRNDYADLDLESYKKAEKVINFLNKVGLLIEKHVLSAKDVLGLTHTVIIRCWYQVEEVARFHESKIGGRYGRRAERLANRAKRYHDVRAMHRIHPIKLNQGKGEPIVIYETKRKGGLRGVFQRMGWGVRNFFKWY